MRPPPSLLAPALLLAASLLGASTALADSEKAETFHVMEIVQVMAGYNGNTAIQAVEMKELAIGQDLVATGAINVYDKDGVLATTLGTFAANVANGASGAHILCATAAFASAFSITPDLVLSAGIPLPSGQVVFEKAGCKVNSVPYGGITTIVANTSVAPTIPTLGATALVRTGDAPTTLTCPLTDSAASRFAIRSGTSASSFLVFQTNTGDTAHVWSTVTGAQTPPLEPVRLQASPNPFRAETRIDAPDWGPLAIHDVQGRLVRVLTCMPGGACPQVAGAFRGSWNGRDEHGRAMPSGVYFLRYSGASGRAVKAIVYLR
ncbi:MAG TPA: hypothetical protein VFX78_03010 [Candidatus Eisenbacteria bacterium]|jgi:hypothetical protein|nr:hypothetical protein [Candidatus Eisenbacteria bacterium]